MIWTETLALVAICGFVDFASGWEVGFFLFYAAPILLMVRFGTRQEAVFIAILCAIVWWWADWQAGHPYITSWHQGWATLIRLGFFLMVVAGGLSVKARISLLQQARDLEYQLVTLTEREQQRIGQDLHDGICQYFAAVGCAAGALKNDLDRREAPEAGAAAEIEDLVMSGVASIRDIARGLAPIGEDEHGLKDALEEIASSSSRFFKMVCRFEECGNVGLLDKECAVHLFRIAQEALHNATKHGRATRASIHLSAEGPNVVLSISDNGSGLRETLRNRAGMGMKSMHHRARALGGRLRIGDAPGGGTLVSCSFPRNAPR